MEFQETLKTYRQTVEEGISKWVPPANTRPEILHQAMNYSLQAGGKRLRPILLLAGNALFPGRIDPVPAAVAIECLHTYSLIHDDLPSIDNSAMRRGRPSCHTQFDEAAAILAGDALLTHAFGLLAHAYGDAPELALGLLLDLSDAAGSRKLIGGQMEDILRENGDCTPEQLEYIHLNKTAAMISAAVVMGVRLAEAGEKNLQLAAKLGLSLGHAFQIIDDILDATSDTETLGKTAGQDAANHKNTYIKIHGLDRSRKRAKELTAEAVLACRGFEVDAAFLIALIEWMEHRIN